MDIQSIKNRFGIIGNDPQLNYNIQVAVQVASTDLSVLIFGESGVGKEVFSQVIHALSPRKHNPFIAVNCGAIPEGTIDSELFGHEKGAFTSASDSRKGYFETVNGGTIFLDEIGEMPLGTQARLLRVLETGEYIRVGSSKVLKTNVRVIAATNKDLLSLTQQGKFREDLYYRLNTVPIKVPPLRERKDDIPLLFRKFTNDFASRYKSEPIRLDESAIQLIQNYPWPGNVRELKNIAEQVSVLSTSNVISAEELQKYFPNATTYNQLAVFGQTTHGASPFYNPLNAQNQQSSNTERELLYKIIFEIKKDINDLKQLMYQIIGGRNVMSEDINPMPDVNASDFIPLPPSATDPETHFNTPAITNFNHSKNPDIILHTDQSNITQHEDVEETLSLEEMEKNFIQKALRKHRGKRKDAALELGISDRTLYRKIKEYGLED